MRGFGVPECSGTPGSELAEQVLYSALIAELCPLDRYRNAVMNRAFGWIVLSSLLLVGCAGESTDVVEVGEVTDSGTEESTSPSEDQPTTDSGAGDSLALGPENAKIVFVGTHVGEPNPRTGGFKEFTGSAGYDSASSQLTSVSVEIDTTSIWTNEPSGGLTRHLQQEDFFDVRQHPTASFASTSVIHSGGDQYEITGDFTLLGTTKPISFPATASVDGENVTLAAEFTFDRTEWGMVAHQERVEKAVSMTVAIGEKTEPQVAEGGGRGGRGRFDPAERFKQMDANGDGSLSGDEISERLQGRMEMLDADQNGSLTLEEFRDGMQRMFGGGGGRPGGGRGGEGRPERPE